MKNRLFTRIFVLSAVIMAAAIVFSELFITSAVRNSFIHDLKEHLVAQAKLIANDLSFDRPNLDPLCVKFKQQTGFRVTVIAPGGRVLGDSDTASSLMENHARRQEVQQAFVDGTGMSERRSDTLKEDLLYVAQRITAGTTVRGVVRLSMPLTRVDASVNALRLKIIAVVVAILLLTGFFSLGQLERIRRLTRQINEFSRSLAGGAIGKRLHLEEGGEFDEIAESLNAMSAELRNSIALIEGERKRLNVILHSIPDVLLILEADGTVRLASSASRKYFGESALLGRQVIEVVRSPLFFTLLEEARRKAATCTGEVRLDYPEERYFSSLIAPLSYQQDELSGFVVVLHDITQLKKLEQTRKDFVANISHEIKTPITAIGGFADTLLDGALHDPEYAEKFLRIIKANSERINSLVDDLMTISKIELGAMRLEKNAVDISDALESVQVLLRPKAEGKGLYLKTAFFAEHMKIPADRDKFIQIFTNLVDNAIKFTDTGGVTVGAELQEGRLQLYVQDTGIGIPEKHLPRLGERFYRVDPSRSRKMGGTGLGLAIVKHLVKAHGWDLRIESVAEKGTKVSILCEETG